MTIHRIVELIEVTKTYVEAGAERRVLDRASAAFSQGEFTAVLGRSGSGKTTLLNLVAGIDAPTAGEVWVDGRRIDTLPERERTLFRRGHIGFVFQFFNLIPTLTVGENVSLPLELLGRRDAAAQARDLLDRVGLADRVDTFPDRLSGGEQQRVAIARALAADAPLILADEPTGNLDEDTGTVVLDLLTALTADRGRTLIMATHSRTIASTADRVLRVDHGHLVEATLEDTAAGETASAS